MQKKRGNDTRIEIYGNKTDEFVNTIVDILARSCLESYFQKLSIENAEKQRYNPPDISKDNSC